MLISFLYILVFLKSLFHRNSKPNTVLTTSIRIKTTQSTKMENFLRKSSDNLTSNIIELSAGDKQPCYEIIHDDVTILGSAGSHDHGSSKVKLKNFVDYKWEVKNYPGHLVAVHIDGKHIAYVINVNNRVSGTEGMVRVVNNNQRALIKGMTGEVLDLQFAHIEKERILACIDIHSLYVHRIETIANTLNCQFLLKIEDPLENYTPKFDKIAWCPYVPEECPTDDEDDMSQLIVWSRSKIFQCFNLSTILEDSRGKKLTPNEIKRGYVRNVDESSCVTWIGLSPDGTTLGAATEDGFIRFYQVYFYENEPRRLHQYKPHAGKPVTSFFFLDNLTKSSTDAYWRYALTGAEDNTEFKVWDCSTWQCLQTFRIRPQGEQRTKFVAEIDRTASYLVLSNIEARVFYVLQIMVDTTGSSEGSGEDGKIEKTRSSKHLFVRSVSEFPLSSPILSFSIIDAAVRKYKCALNESFLNDDMDDYEEDNNAMSCVVIRMFVVQPKSLQECQIFYQPKVDEPCDLKSTITSEGEISKDHVESDAGSSKSNESIKTEKTDPACSADLTTIPPLMSANSSTDRLESTSPAPISTASSNKSFSQVNLMTPEAFSSSSSRKTPECVSNEVLSTILMLAGVTNANNAANNADNVNLFNFVNNKLIEEEQQKLKQSMEAQKKFISIENSKADNLASGGSSPSREVQEIMSLQEYECRKSSYVCEDEVVALTQAIEKMDAAEIQQSAKNLLAATEQQDLMDAIAPDHNPSPANIAPSATEWPKVPNVQAVHSIELPNSTTANSELTQINAKMSQLIDLVQHQSSQISSLQNEIAELRSSRVETKKYLSEFTYTLEKQLSKLLEEYLKRYEREHKQKLEKFVAGKDVQNRELRDSVIQVMNQFVMTQLSEKLSGIILMEMQRTILPLIVGKLDAIQHQIQVEVAGKLTATDKVVKDSIAHVCRSKNIIDTFGKSVLLGVQGSLQAAFIESMSNTLIPAYEKSSQDMFRQLREAFSTGIKEFMEQFDGYLSQLQPVQDTTEEIITKFASFKDDLDTVLVKHKKIVADTMLENRKDLKSLEGTILRHLTELIRKEIRQSFESQAASLEDSVLSVVRSQAHTPAPSIYDVQDQIKNLLAQGQINKAFHQALIANDLSLVEFTLDKADYKTVFNPCCLEQTVLLSLIQQISADMNNHNDIKQRYLSDGILNLNQNDPITKEHAPKVMAELYRNCQSFLVSHPKSHLGSNVRMIMMAIQGMGYKMTF